MWGGDRVGALRGDGLVEVGGCRAANYHFMSGGEITY